jgi:hypothetical protein
MFQSIFTFCALPQRNVGVAPEENGAEKAHDQLFFFTMMNNFIGKVYRLNNGSFSFRATCIIM